MLARVRRLLILALASWLVAGGLYATLRATYGQRSAFVHVRWAAGVDAATRAALERRYSLVGGVARDRQTWAYELIEVSGDNIRALVTNPAIEDTHYLHRTAYRVWRTAARGGYHSARPPWIAASMEGLVWGLGAIGVLGFAGAGLGWARSRRDAGTGRGDARSGPADAGPYVREDGRARPVTAGPNEAGPGEGGGYRWTVATAALALPLVASLAITMWRAPFPISETVALMETAGVLGESSSAADAATVRSFFDPSTRSWYRPLYHLTWYSLWHVTGDIGTTLLLFKLLEVGLVVALVTLFIWALRPRTLPACAAAAFAVAVLVGMPAFQENLEVPLLYTLIGMPMILAVWTIVQRRARWWQWDPLESTCRHASLSIL